MAGQIQYVKIVGMLMDNHHIKSTKKDGYFSKENFAKNFGLTLDGNNTAVVSSATPVSKKDGKKSARGRPSMHSIFSVSQGHPRRFGVLKSQAHIALKETKTNQLVCRQQSTLFKGFS